MAIRVIEERKKDPPDWMDAVGEFGDDEISAAVGKANDLPGSPADPNMVQVPFPVLVMPITAAALDFGSATVTKIPLGQLVASQTWVRRDRLVAHVEAGGEPQDKKTPFVSLPIIAEGGIIIDGHHRCTAIWLLKGSDFEIPVWTLPVGIATGHPR